jgi:hypothetical protein
MNRLKMPVWSFAAGLIILQMILVAIIVHGESLTFDEGDHIFAGYMMWHSGDYGLNPEHPPLVKLVATLPLLQEKLWVPTLQQRMFKGEAYRDGRDFMERNDGPGHRLIFRMRLAAGVFAVGLSVMVFLMGSKLFGESAGLLALLLVVFEPNVLANSDLVTTDVGVACFFLATIYCFYRYARQPSLIRLLLTGLVAGLTLSAKHSGILLAPMLLGLTLVEIACAERGRRKRMAGTLLGGFAAIVVLAVVVLWAFYGFRYAARPAGLVMNPTLSEYAAPLKGVNSWLIGHLANWRLLPESYLMGMTDIHYAAQQVSHLPARARLCSRCLVVFSSSAVHQDHSGLDRSADFGRYCSDQQAAQAKKRIDVPGCAWSYLSGCGDPQRYEHRHSSCSVLVSTGRVAGSSGSDSARSV